MTQRVEMEATADSHALIEGGWGVGGESDSNYVMIENNNNNNSLKKEKKKRKGHIWFVESVSMFGVGVSRCRSDNTTDLNPEVVSLSSVWIQSHDSSFFMAFPRSIV